ncbi:MAG: hypothetical protein D6744_02180 [Planctomycetota bacterium]|nr:MAG: hypothetical protein D6744_02180 [Planctomycetota bacterium]
MRNDPQRFFIRMTSCRLLLAGAILAAAIPPGALAKTPAKPYAASATAVKLDRQIDWSHARLIAVQDANRYKTLDSFARESLSAMCGKEHLPGLSPLASLFELIFNKDAYADTPIVRLKDKGVRMHLSSRLPEDARDRILRTGMITPRELASRPVQQLIAELEPKAIMITAMRRVRNAEAVVRFVDQMIRIVPNPTEVDALWFAPGSLQALLPDDLLQRAGTTRQEVFRRYGAAEGLSSEQALQILSPWASLRDGWLRGDAATVQAALARLGEVLPAVAPEGGYPSESQRAAEARYYAMGKFTWGWMIYFLGGVIGLFALVTRWRTPWVISLILLVAAMGVHAYGLALRWYIVGRIPVANMFEAVVASAWMGIALALVFELIYRTRVSLFAAHCTGFMALVLGQFVIPGGGTITSIMGILDDVMLRIHTVLIIASYALIFLAAVIAVLYLFGYYYVKSPGPSAEVGLTFGLSGVAMYAAASFWVYHATTSGAAFFETNPTAARAFGLVAALALLTLALARYWPQSLRVPLGATSAALLIIGASLAYAPRGFSIGLAIIMACSGFAWALGTVGGRMLQKLLRREAEPALAMAGGGSVPVKSIYDRPVMAGAAPGDEGRRDKLPTWLHHFDWAHLIMLNMAFIMLFVGLILGAVWADYSWGRPWGWDPKETFALNTWLIYAILIHVRFITKDRGLWTAWLSVAGCLMMAFNWCFVNFFLVGLHSYA